MEEKVTGQENDTNNNNTNTNNSNTITNSYTNNVFADQGENFIDDADGEGPSNQIIEIHPKLNLMLLQKNYLDQHNTKSEDDSLILNRCNGQPVVLYNMGPEMNMSKLLLQSIQNIVTLISTWFMAIK